jgi:hypothetical protein
MAVELVVLGTGLANAVHTRNLAELIEKYSLAGFDESFTHNHVWSTGRLKDEQEDESLRLMCTHFRIEGFSVMGASTSPEGKRFLVEAMKLPGVYMECPECCKRSFWEENERALESQPVG